MEGDSYELVYFGTRGRAEAIRWLLDAGGVAFKDTVVTREAWPALKAKTPFGSLPLLKVRTARGDEWSLGQSLPILRFLGSRLGLAGRDEREKALLESRAERVAELWSQGFPAIATATFSGDSEGRAAAVEGFVEGPAGRLMAEAEGWLADSPHGWLAGDRLSWADLYLAEWLDRIENAFRPGTLKDFPGLEKFHARVTAIPAIAQRPRKRDDAGIAPFI